FFTDSHFVVYHPATTESYTLSLHDALPIFAVLLARLKRSDVRHRELLAAPHPWKTARIKSSCFQVNPPNRMVVRARWSAVNARRSEEHTSELQSPCNLVCRLLLEKKNEVPY